MIGQAAFQLNFVAVNHFAARLGEGRVSGLNYAWQMMMLPHGILALSISTVVFPTMARAYERGDLETVRATFMRGLTPLLFLIIPASVGLFEFRTAIIQTVFQSGAFSVRSTALVAEPLAFLALGLTWYALVEVLARTYYAMQDTRTPVLTGIAIIVVNLVLCWQLAGRVGHAGLAIGLSVSTGIEALVLFGLLRAKLGNLDPALGSWLARVALATATMALAAEAVRPRLEAATAAGVASRPMQLLLLGYAMGIVGLIYLAAARYLRLPEADLVLGSLVSRVARRQRRQR